MHIWVSSILRFFGVIFITKYSSIITIVIYNPWNHPWFGLAPIQIGQRGIYKTNRTNKIQDENES